MTVFLPRTIKLFAYQENSWTICARINLFPKSYIVFWSHTKSSKKTHGGGVLIAIKPRFCGSKWKYDLQFYKECLWVELPSSNGVDFINSKHYFPPDSSPNIILNNFSFLENKLDTKNYILMGDFNTLNFDWECGPSLPVITIPNLKKMLFTTLCVFCD